MVKWLAVLTHAGCDEMMMRQVHAICALNVDHMFINLYSGESVACDINTRCHYTMFHVIGMKPQLWKTVLSPDKVESFDFMWVMDSDIYPQNVNLSRIAQHNVNVSQPSVVISNVSRGSSHSQLNHRKSCKVARTQFVELMTPIFNVKAWITFYNVILSNLDDLCSDWGLDYAWSVLNRDTTVFYDETVFHLNTKQMKKRNKSVCPQMKFSSNVVFIHDKFFNETPPFTRKFYGKVLCTQLFKHVEA